MATTFKVEFAGGQVKETATGAAPVVANGFDAVSDVIAAASQKTNDVIRLAPNAVDVPIPVAGIVASMAIIKGDLPWRIKYNGHANSDPVNTLFANFGTVSGVLASNPDPLLVCTLKVYSAV